MNARSRLTMAFLVAAMGPTVIHAQEDFRSADAGRPIRVEDARPLKYREWEIEMGSRAAFEEGARGILGVVELKAGLIRNTQVGVEVETAVESTSGGAGTVSGLEAVSGHVLYALRRETTSAPALALRVDVSSPGAGDVRHVDAQAGMKAIATRSFGRARLHGNAGVTWASPADGGDYWRVGIGGDYPVGLFSRAILADVYAEIPIAAGPTRTWVDVGTRIQVTNRTVLDFGLSARIDEWRDGNSNVELVLGLSRVFGIGRPGPSYPDPSIR